MNKKSQKIVICGYYGRGNFGDEAILRVILSKIKKQNPEAKILILNPKKIFSVVRNISGADYFIFGGGSILQNSTSDASLLYYLSVIGLSKLFCKRKIMLANGIGPFIKRKIPLKILFNVIKHAINCFDFISVRDSDSQKALSALLPNRKIHLVPDPALISFKNINQQLKSNQNDCFEKDFFIYIPHANSILKSGIKTNRLAKTLKFLCSKHKLQLKIAVLNKKEDLPLALEICAHISEAEIIAPQHEEDAANSFRGAKFIISSRYHGSLLATVLEKPTISISTDPKIRGLCKDFYIFPTQRYEMFENPLLFNAYIEKMMAFHTHNAKKIKENINKYTKESESALNEILNFSF